MSIISKAIYRIVIKSWAIIEKKFNKATQGFGKANEEHFTSAITNTVKKLKLNLVDYTITADNSITLERYIFYFQFKDAISVHKIRVVEKTLDSELRKLNLDYDRARNNKILGMVKIIPLSPGNFNLIREFLSSKGVSENQIKISRVINNNRNVLNIIL